MLEQAQRTKSSSLRWLIHWGELGRMCFDDILFCTVANALYINNGNVLYSCSVLKDGLGASCYKGQGLCEMLYKHLSHMFRRNSNYFKLQSMDT